MRDWVSERVYRVIEFDRGKCQASVIVSVMTNGSQVGHISCVSTSVVANVVSHLDCGVAGAWHGLRNGPWKPNGSHLSFVNIRCCICCLAFGSAVLRAHCRDW